MKLPNKKITLTLEGMDGNAFALLGAFARQAREEGWTADEIKAVKDEATKGDYNQLLTTLIDFCEGEEAE